MKNILYILSLLFIASCDGDDDMNPNEMDMANLPSCNEYESITRDSICDWYSGQTLILDDPFDGMCFDLLTRVGRITFDQDVFKIGTGNIYRTQTCSFTFDNADFENIHFEGEIFDNNKTLLAQLQEKDIVGVKGVFSYSDDDFIVDHSLTLIPNEITQDFESPFDDCGLLGKAWYQTIGGIEYRLTFLHWDNVHFVIDTRHIDYQVYNRPTYYLGYNGNCNSFEMENIQTGEKELYNIQKLTQDSLIIEHENSKIEKFYR